LANPPPFNNAIVDWLYRSHDALEAAISDPLFGAAIDYAARLISSSLRLGGQILIAGNGGSHAQAQHFAAELVGRFAQERTPLAAVALGSDPTILSALANDYGFERAIERQLAALADERTVFVAISTSGLSANIVRAAQLARLREIPIVAMTGRPGNPLSGLAQCSIVAPTSETALAQQLHLVAAHAICGIVEQVFLRLAPMPEPQLFGALASK
jgi:D-sedoheptulose 7-phosphate isomerase